MFQDKRERMVKFQIIARGVKDKRVLEAMMRVPRHLFVSERDLAEAYDDTPLPIGHGQTISQPYIVAYMTECLNITKEDRILEIGTGSGYEAAILGELGGEVITLEIIPEIYSRSKNILEDLGYENIEVINSNGYEGWEKRAPYDKIILSASPTEIPGKLVEQLAPGGRLVAPVGDIFQELIIVEKDPDGNISEMRLFPVRFVPMVHS